MAVFLEPVESGCRNLKRALGWAARLEVSLPCPIELSRRRVRFLSMLYLFRIRPSACTIGAWDC